MTRKLFGSSMALRGGFQYPLVLLASLIASTVQAGGFNIGWNDCGNNGVEARSFSCGSDAGLNTFYLSVMPNSPLPKLAGFDAKISVYSNSPSLSPWWHLESSGGCRSRALSANFNFVTGPYTCEDPWGGVGMGGISWQYFDLQPGARAKIQVICAVQPSAAISANTGTEYYLCAISISNTGAASPSCAGCSDALCFVVDQVTLEQPNDDLSEHPDVSPQIITSAMFRQKLTWQSGATGGQCASINTPKQSTWGGIKSIYH